MFYEIYFKFHTCIFSKIKLKFFFKLISKCLKTHKHAHTQHTIHNNTDTKHAYLHRHIHTHTHTHTTAARTDLRRQAKNSAAVSESK